MTPELDIVDVRRASFLVKRLQVGRVADRKGAQQPRGDRLLGRRRSAVPVRAARLDEAPRLVAGVLAIAEVPKRGGVPRRQERQHVQRPRRRRDRPGVIFAEETGLGLVSPVRARRVGVDPERLIGELEGLAVLAAIGRPQGARDERPGVVLVELEGEAEAQLGLVEPAPERQGPGEAMVRAGVEGVDLDGDLAQLERLLLHLLAAIEAGKDQVLRVLEADEPDIGRGEMRRLGDDRLEDLRRTVPVRGAPAHEQILAARRRRGCRTPRRSRLCAGTAGSDGRTLPEARAFDSGADGPGDGSGETLSALSAGALGLNSPVLIRTTRSLVWSDGSLSYSSSRRSHNAL